MALRCHCSHYPSSSSLPLLYTLHHSCSRPQPFGKSCFKSLRTVSFCAIPSLPSDTTISHPSTSSIFLPFLQEGEDEIDGEEKGGSKNSESDQSEQQGQDLDSVEDPMLKFFKFRASSHDPDPGREGKLSLQKNRRTSWRLASGDEIEPVEETEFSFNNGLKDEDQLGVGDSNSSPEAKGAVGEILRIARNVPENMTLGELLASFKGRVGERECVEVLGLMGQEGLVLGCLYFFEWMGLQEPSLITPRACSVLFPVLGRARMGDKLMVLFRNLPNAKQFSDVHVYNAAISGLLYSGRYGFLLPTSFVAVIYCLH